ncbi:MAG: membrane protein insertase YidC [Luteolibacter sp.]
MYDRKTWIVLAACAALLSANIYYSSQNTKKDAERRALEKTTTVAETEPAPAEAASQLEVDTPPPSTEEQFLTLENDKVIYTFTNLGGGIKNAQLKDQTNVGDKSLVTLNRFGQGAVGAIANPDQSLDQTIYSYKQEESIPGKSVVYIQKLPSGLIAKKTFSLIESQAPGAPYLLDFKLSLQNVTANTQNLSQWSLFLGEASPLYQAENSVQTGFFWHENGSMKFKDGHAFKGSWISSPQTVINSPQGDTLEYAGVTNQYFTTVIRPAQPAVSTAWGKRGDIKLQANAAALSSVRAGISLPAATLAPQETKDFSYRVFMGPKHNDMLRKMEKYWGKGWGDLMQYGDWLQVAARPLNWLLNFFHRLVDGVATKWSWGIAVILLTLTVRTAIMPLAAKSTHAMKRMSKLQPIMAQLKEKYPDDPNKLNTEMMGLYKKYGINPLGGCLPMLIQIPVFFGFFKMLQYAVELRHQGFLWLTDLSQPDTLYTVHLPFQLPIIGDHIPINILPILMAVTSFAQMAMMPKAGDPMQQKIMKFMPLMFFFFCYNYASALALYWTTQNIFSIGQTWIMNKIPEPELVARADSGKKSWVQRMAERQAEIQKAQQQAGGMKNVTPANDAKKKRNPRTGG